MRHRGQITHQSYRGGGPRDFGPAPIVERPRMLMPTEPEVPELRACYCTGLRHEHDRHGCPAERVEAP